MIDFIKRWAKRTGIAVAHFISWLGIAPSKYYDWQGRYGKANEHNALIPRDFWLEDWEKKAIIDFYLAHPLEGYRRLTFMMLDRDVVAVSPSSVYRVLSASHLSKIYSAHISVPEGIGDLPAFAPYLPRYSVLDINSPEPALPFLSKSDYQWSWNSTQDYGAFQSLY